MLPSLSIVIPTYNRPALLRACLQTVARFAPGGTETLVVDDASPQGVASRVAEGFAGVKILRMDRRRGFCVAANAGIREARGEIVEMLNDDTEVTAGWARAALAHFRRPDVGSVAPLVLRWPGNPGARDNNEAIGQGRQGKAVIDSAGDRFYLGGVAGKRWHGELLELAFVKPCRVFGASASSAFYRREFLLQVGAFPESFGAYFEDVDLAFRLHGAGCQVIFEPASRVLHHVSASYGRSRRRLLAQQSRNEERVFWRNLPKRVLIRALPSHLAVLAAKAWRRWQDGSLVPFLSGRLQVLADVVEILRHRRWLSPFASVTDLKSWHVDSKFWGQRPAGSARPLGLSPDEPAGPICRSEPGYGRAAA